MRFAVIPTIAISAPIPSSSSTPSLTSGPSVSSTDEYDLECHAHLVPPPVLPHYLPETVIARCPPRICSSAINGSDTGRFDAVVLTSASHAHGPLNPHKHLNCHKDVALNAHRGKQEQRRAIFLAKIGAPPSPTAVDMPVTPPDSPAMFYFSLPSPGLASPLTHFKALVDSPGPNTRVERVNFQDRTACHHEMTRPDTTLPEMRRHSLPSLEDISTHFNLNAGAKPSRYPRAPLPEFLKNRFSLSANQLMDVAPGTSQIYHHNNMKRSTLLPAASRPLNRPVCTHHMSNAAWPISPLALTEANLAAFDERAKAALGLAKLQRRVSAESAGRRMRCCSAPSGVSSVQNISAPQRPCQWKQ